MTAMKTKTAIDRSLYPRRTPWVMVNFLTADEKELIRQQAAEAGLSISNWFRKAAGLPLLQRGGFHIGPKRRAALEAKQKAAAKAKPRVKRSHK